MAGKTVVVLGGGVGGLVTANELRQRLGPEHRVVLVDREGVHVFWPSLLWLQVGLRESDKMVRDLAALQKKGIEVIKGQVEVIDPARRAVQVNGARLEADYLVVSLGAQLAPEQVPGLPQAGHNLYTLDGATAIRDTRKGLTAGALVVLVARTPFKCPAAPYEAAMLLDHDLRKRKAREQVSVALYSPEPGPMGVAGPEVSAAVRHLLQERDIAYHPQHQLTGVDPGTKTLRFSNNAEARYDLLVYVPPHVAPTVVREAGLVGESGWVPVDRHTMETKYPGVYAIGDVTGIPLSMGLPLPKAGVFAHHEGEAVAKSIAAQVLGGGEPGSFDGHGECFIEVGGGRAGLGRGNFYAEPRPAVKLYKPGRHWHAAKMLFEKEWFRRWF
ncbi:MAG: pyridine nucleotide-disulfide oxidoreductase [Dehalococcoidia bacterium]|nr:pyridine nucleotide-disulfide oxidoreductase [Dehalococcoidia bacterium]